MTQKLPEGQFFIKKKMIVEIRNQAQRIPTLGQALEVQAITAFLETVIEEQGGRGAKSVSFDFPVDPEGCRCRCSIEQFSPLIGRRSPDLLVTQQLEDSRGDVYAKDVMFVDRRTETVCGASYNALGDQDGIREPVSSLVGLNYLRWTVGTIQKGLARQEETPF